jgi:hypothetical protein
MPVMYMAETGVYRTEKKSSPPIATISAPFSEDYPDAPVFAVKVRDDAMTADTPPITKGAFALCVDFARAKLTVATGLAYLIRRS